MFTSTIKNLTSNLESLREFLITLDSFLMEKAAEFLDLHEKDLAPLYFFAKKAGLPVDSEYESLTAEEIKERIKNSEVEVDVEISGSDDNPEYKMLIGGKGTVRFEKAVKGLFTSHKRMELLYRGSLLNLTSIVELFISQLLHKQFTLNPEIISTKDKIFSINDLMQYESIDDVRQHYINTKIEELLYGSFIDWIGYIKNSNKLSMNYLESDMDILKETFLRRNLVIHNGGVINSIYLSKVPKSFSKGIKLGNKIQIDKAYINKRIDCFERNCVLIAAELWKKLDPLDETRADILNHSAYHHMLGKRWTISESLSQFVMQDKQLSEPAQTIAKINYWLSRKRQGKWEDIKEEVSNLDFTAKNFRFQIALAALAEKADAFFEVLPLAIVSKQISQADLNEFPIFEEMRRDPRFEQYRKEQATPENPILEQEESEDVGPEEFQPDEDLQEGTEL